MPTQDQARLAEERARPRIAELWWALQPLKTVIRFMNSGAHPDDETSEMLAALAFRDGINLSYACSTRGEGGQNDIGTEMSEDLGALRTAEMERACDVLDMRLYWLSESAEDPITDFGFSKSGEETLGKWGRDRTLTRFVEILRIDRPDILCPTFLDIPGQHGHHRAMTLMAREAMAAAADPSFPSNLPPWQVAKLYLPAWSGAGGSYDDEVPPPPATLTVDGSGRDPVTGFPYVRIGQQSRAFHRTQGMGRWVPASDARMWPLHLVESHVPGPDTALWSGLPWALADLAETPGVGPIADALRAAADRIDAALAALPKTAEVARHAKSALLAVRDAMRACPEALRPDLVHRLAAKEAQLSRVLRIALGVEAHAVLDQPWLHPGETTAIQLDIDGGSASSPSLHIDIGAGVADATDTVDVPPDASPADPYRAHYDPAAPPAPALVLRFDAGGTDVATRLPFVTPPVVLPARSASLSPDRAVINRAADRRQITVALGDRYPESGTPDLTLPDGWHADRAGQGFTVQTPEDVAEGLYRLPLLIDGAPARSVRRIAYPHIAPTARNWPAELTVRVVHAELPTARIGYIGSGNDRVANWLAELGADVVELPDVELHNADALTAYDMLIIGIFAMRFRPGLTAAMPGIREWVENGGTLVTLYHRPWDNWDPDTIPPRRLEIGQPSLRWRVTDETAAVTHLAPDHPILTTPNRIGPEDWDGWHKERGLYFAKSWDAAYQPLLEMADPGEAPHRGALLVADIGAGRHVHTSLILHHQMEKLVPGAFRLMANLVTPRR